MGLEIGPLSKILAVKVIQGGFFFAYQVKKGHYALNQNLKS